MENIQDQKQLLLDKIGSSSLDLSGSVVFDESKNSDDGNKLDLFQGILDETLKEKQSLKKRELIERNCFDIAGFNFATPFDSTSMLLEIPPIAKLPRTPDWVLGLANIKSRLVTIIDIAHYLGLNSEQPSNLEAHYYHNNSSDNNDKLSEKNNTKNNSFNNEFNNSLKKNKNMLLIFGRDKNSVGIVINDIPKKQKFSVEEFSQAPKFNDKIDSYIKGAFRRTDNLKLIYLDFDGANFFNNLENEMFN